MFVLFLVSICLFSVWSCHASWVELNSSHHTAINRNIGRAVTLDELYEGLVNDDDDDDNNNGDINALDEFFSIEDGDNLLEEGNDLKAVEPVINAKPVNRKESFTTGFLRLEYLDVSSSTTFFVQAVVQAIGVCYQNSQQNPRFQKITKIVTNKGTNTVILKISDFTTSNCAGNPVRSFSRQQNFNSVLITSDNVRLKVKSFYVSQLRSALRLEPKNSNGFLISYYAADDNCSGPAFQYLVGTARCSNFPDFFGRVKCRPNKKNLTFLKYPFNPDRQCLGANQKLLNQKFKCTNQGTRSAPNFQTADCIPPS